MLELKSLSYRSILAPTSLKLDAGMIYALMGANGAGKTTLLKSIALLLKPTFGEILFYGESLFRMSPLEVRKRITFVPHEMTIAFPFTVSEFLDMGFYPHPPEEKKKEKVLALTDLKEKRDAAIHLLSSGEKRRAFFARALLSKASLFLLDEVTASLDSSHQEALWDLIHSLKAEGKTVVISTHDRQAAELHADKILHLESGCLK